MKEQINYNWQAVDKIDVLHKMGYRDENRLHKFLALKDELGNTNC